MWCRSSMDLLQDLALSKKSSSPLSTPSKSNLRHIQTDKPTQRHRGVDERHEGGQVSELGREPGVITRTVIKLHNKAQQRFCPTQAKYSSALHHTESTQKHMQFTVCNKAFKECKTVICTFLNAHALFFFTRDFLRDTTCQLSSSIYCPTQFLWKTVCAAYVCRGTHMTAHWAKERYSTKTSRPLFSSLRNSLTHL